MLQTSGAPEKGPTDIAGMIAGSMRRMGVTGLPRNYEIFYEVFTGSNRDLVRDFEALNGRPTQDALDKLALKYFTQNNRQAVVEDAQEQIATRAQEILSLLGRERSSLEKFGVILDQTSNGLSGRSAISHDLMRKIVGIMAAATETTIAQGRQITQAMEEKSSELEAMRSQLQRYKRLADTDPLTRIWNRRAFDKRMAGIFDEQRSIMFHALILADIDGFKAINDQYGHPVGDKILQGVAQILKTQCVDECFVARTGGEEFAIIVDGLTEEATVKLAETMRLAVEKAEFVIGSGARKCGPIRISLGVCMASDAANADELYAKTDQALYASKVDGRNRVTLFSSIPKGKFMKNWLLYRND
ncbi:MAG: GGDEF domain-containing protein [Nitratireductor sp.]|uniref:GGDEF domain-containing protein n=1 Tax=Nitratireductor sp. B36 TaxID=2762059 RepID=UPI000C9561F7|nr:GGDEF domain-containing protein [Nitratireductor sp. B36]MAS12726.1 GGDEF domain-containing protein [Nitratireductor sp.]MCC5777757.1 GGDEF domain-containing protein [Nitratireductor sp. B36]